MTFEFFNSSSALYVLCQLSIVSSGKMSVKICVYFTPRFMNDKIIMSHRCYMTARITMEKMRYNHT